MIGGAGFRPENTSDQILAPAGSYEVLFSTDDHEFGGQGRIDHTVRHLTKPQDSHHFIRTYLPARTATVFRKVD